MSQTLFMLIGNPGSGKSTFVKTNQYSEPYDVVLSTDAWLETFAKMNDLTYNEAFEMYYKDAEKALKSDLAYALRSKKNIIYDQTNLTKKSRAKKLKSIPKDYKKIAVFFDTSTDIIISENQKRIEHGRSIPIGTLTNMIQSLEFPCKDEGFDDIVIIERHS